MIKPHCYFNITSKDGLCNYPVVDLRGEWGSQGAHPLRPKIFSISCIFLYNLAKSYVGAALPWRVGGPSYGNPGSAPVIYTSINPQGYSVLISLNNALYNNTHSLIGKPCLAIIVTGFHRYLSVHRKVNKRTPGTEAGGTRHTRMFPCW